MFTKSKLLILFVSILALVGVIDIIKPYLATYPQKPQNISSESPKAVQLELKYSYEVINVTDKEKKEILQFIKVFETLQYERRGREVLALFTPPANKEEQDGLDFLEGKDLNVNVGIRLYATHGVSWLVN